MDESIFVSDAATTSSVIMNQQVSVDDQMDSNSSTMEESLSLDDSVHVGIIRNHTDALQMNRIVEAIDLPPLQFIQYLIFQLDTFVGVRSRSYIVRISI